MTYSDQWAMTTCDACRNDSCHFYVAERSTSMSSHVSIPPSHGFPNGGTSLSLTLWNGTLPPLLHTISLATSTEPPARKVNFAVLSI